MPRNKLFVAVQLRDDLRQCQEEAARKNKLLAQLARYDPAADLYTRLCGPSHNLTQSLLLASFGINHTDVNLLPQ